ncbi:hypothetical protein B484DRAFT_455003 [Ochromonadaceae sp. CCMP2298]|nr:hypothetical protein B484DRAFT_455003 [Ochromonadaceae sp. CCMP2298]
MRRAVRLVPAIRSSGSSACRARSRLLLGELATPAPRVFLSQGSGWVGRLAVPGVRAFSSSSSSSSFGGLPLPLPCDLSDEEVYQRVSDASMEELEGLLAVLEEQDEDAEVDASMGVLTLRLGPVPGVAGRERAFHWVVNKQTPNRQLWWSSALSGPRRYEWDPSLSGGNGSSGSSGSSSGSGGGGSGRLLNCWRFTRAIDHSSHTGISGSGSGSGSDSAASDDVLLCLLQREILQVAGIDILNP